MAEAATGSGEIAQNIVAVAGAADETTRGAAKAREATNELARKTADLSALLGKFAR
ncbi:hypothetical protein [Cellulomonas citrea]|uniref:hypothetical protein n=1 Tax=Cellulomonas citrea TaxID=1909423 RepID=UPI001356EF44|nr:hypothetical protein [Cellulomonas citrea]